MSNGLNLAEGWAETTLDQLLVALESGSRPRGGVRGIADGIPSIGGEHLNDDGGFRFERLKFVPEKFFQSMRRGHIKTGDILIVKDGATTGKVSLVRDDFPYNPAVVNEHVFLCRTADSIYSPFVFRFLYSQEGQNRILENFRGSAQGGINQSFAPGTSVPLAPLAEQKRIVAKVEELLGRVNAARQRLSQVPAILKRFRQAILANACSGKLTEDWRGIHEINETGSALLERVLAERESEDVGHQRARTVLYVVVDDQTSEIPHTWALATIGQITRNFDGQRIPVKKDDRTKRQGNYRYYGASGVIDTIDDYLFDGDYLLIGEDGANLVFRATPIAFQASGKFWVNNHAHVVQPHGGIPLGYLEVFFNGIDLQPYVTGSAQPKLTQANMNRIRIPLPPLEEQHEIVRRVEALLALADGIERRVAAATRQAEKLTQSILAKAFRGELVRPEAELARAEGRDYETAEQLLTRIHTERETAAEQSKSRKPRSTKTDRPAKGKRGITYKRAAMPS